MSVWSTIKSKISEVINRMIGSKTIEQALNVQTNISTEMEKAIEIIVLTAWNQLEKIELLEMFTTWHGIKYKPQKDTGFYMCALSLAMVYSGEY